jgi:[NiFe] hydrogenase assembly HybE family chaperone
MNIAVSNAPSDPIAAALAGRVLALERLFAGIAATRMQGLAMVNDGLAVRAVGFQPEPGAVAAVGVLVTPWFMNLVWLPLAPDASPLAVGATRNRAVGNARFDFIGADEPGFGPFEACSLFSPMFEFADQAAAEATAAEVLKQLREPPPKPVATPSRRALLFGRGAGAAA